MDEKILYKKWSIYVPHQNRSKIVAVLWTELFLSLVKNDFSVEQKIVSIGEMFDHLNRRLFSAFKAIDPRLVIEKHDSFIFGPGFAHLVSMFCTNIYYSSLFMSSCFRLIYLLEIYYVLDRTSQPPTQSWNRSLAFLSCPPDWKTLRLFASDFSLEIFKS